jgi:hypothetical protein
MGGGGSEGGGGIRPEDLRPIADRVRGILGEGDQSRKNVFLARAYEDEDEVNLLRGQAKNPDTNFELNDWSLREPFDSQHAEYIKRGIRERIRHSSITLVYLSLHAAASRWVDWEIRESLRLGKRVVGVYSGSAQPPLPPAFREFDLKSIPWRHEDLMREIGD